VVARYSCLPYYQEFEQDVLALGAQLINTHAQHRYIADLQSWYQDLHDLTPRTWFQVSDVPLDQPGSFVLKGETNSKKFGWDRYMFAPSRQDLGAIQVRLQDDMFLGTQRIYAREFVPLKTYMVGIHGLPVTDEYRFFVLDGEMLCGAYYWASHTEDLVDMGIFPDVQTVPPQFLSDVVSRVGNKARFYVVDVAQTADGRWIVIELNDGQMSGLSDIRPADLYGAIARKLGT
jgi:hypothetical protein